MPPWDQFSWFVAFQRTDLRLGTSSEPAPKLAWWKRGEREPVPVCLLGLSAGEVPHLLPPRILMIMLPLSTVHPLKAWADVTESIVLFPTHSLGHRPAHGEQINLHRKTEMHTG